MARPRDPRIDERILQTTRELLEQGSFADLTVAAITERAEVSKPALYRRWPSLTHLAFEVMVQGGLPPDLPNTGSIREDLFLLLRTLVDNYAAMDRGLLADQVGTMISDADFSRTVHETTLDPMHDHAFACWQRAEERGEVRPGIDGRQLMGDLAAQVFVRWALRHDDVTDDDIHALIDRFLVGAYADKARALSR
jgi:AcrR family transcriptional regulator